MQTSPYETVKTFELSTDFSTRLAVEISARTYGGRRHFRIASLRRYTAPDGTERRSHWLGLKEWWLKQGLEKQAAEWIKEQEGIERQAAVDRSEETSAAA